MKTNDIIIGGTIVKIRSNDGKSGSLTLSCPVMRRIKTDEESYDRVMKVVNSQKATKEDLRKAATELADLWDNEPSEVVVHHPVLNFNNYTETQNIAQDFIVGDHVVIKGYIKSYHRSTGDGKVRKEFFLYIKTMQKVKSKCETEFGVLGRAYPQPRNDYFLVGTIKSVEKLEGEGAQMIISPYGEPKNELPVYIPKVKESFLRKYRPDTLVCVHALIESPGNIPERSIIPANENDYHILTVVTMAPMAEDRLKGQRRETRPNAAGRNTAGSKEKRIRTTFEEG